MAKPSESSIVHAAIIAFMAKAGSKVLRGTIEHVATGLNLPDMKSTLRATLVDLDRQGRIRYSCGAKGHIIKLRQPVTTRLRKPR